MLYAITLMLMSIGAALAILLFPPPQGRPRAWKLRTSWALWCLQPALLFSALLVGLTIMGSYGYNSSNAPDDVQSWLTFGTFGTVGLGLLAGTVLGGLAWRSARLEQPPTSHRAWSLAATLANTLWFAGGAWLFGAPPVAIGLDVLILVVAAALLLWPSRRPAGEARPQPSALLPSEPVESPDEHLVG